MAISILGALYKRFQDRPGPCAAGGHAGCDAPLHARAVLPHRAHRPSRGTRRYQPIDAGRLAPNALYPCKPGGPNDYVYVFCSRANPEHWQRLLKVIGREDLSGDTRYDTQVARSQRGAEVDAIIAAWTREHTKEEAMHLFGSAGVPVGCSVRHAGVDERSVACRAQASCKRSSTQLPARSSCLPGPCASTGTPAEGQAIAAARSARRGRARLMARHGGQGRCSAARGGHRLSSI